LPRLKTKLGYIQREQKLASRTFWSGLAGIIERVGFWS